MTIGVETLIDKDLSGRVIGAFYAVYNKLGYGFLENVYTSALAVEFLKRGKQFQREVSIQECFTTISQLRCTGPT